MSLDAHHSTSAEELVLVEALERDGVDLDPKSGALRGVDPLQHLGQASPAGDLERTSLSSKRVERDVDSAHARLREVGRKARQLAAVGGQRQFLQRAGLQVAGHRAEVGQYPLAHQRLAAGDPQLFDAEPDESRGQPVELLQRQEVLLGQERHVLGHAVDAAEVAAVGYRDAQVADLPLERIDERGHSGKVRGRRRARKRGEASLRRRWPRGVARRGARP